MLQLVYNLSIAHLLADFYGQTDRLCKSKLHKGWKSKFLYLHAVIVAMLSWVSVWKLDFIWGAIVIGVSHLLIDGIKSFVERSLSDARYNLVLFVVDQILHLGILVAVAYLFINECEWNQFSWVSSEWRWIVNVVVVALLCWKPSNILIKGVLHYCEVKVECEDPAVGNNFKSGALIGTTERLLVVFFVVIEQYEAIGFLVAAKSILRFNEAKGSEKSEYVLAGTFLSLIIAIVLSWLVKP